MANKSNQAYKIAMVGLLAALSYVVFTYGQVKITLPGGDATSIHLGNAVCVTEDIYLQTLHRTDRRIRSTSSGQD